MFFTPLLWDFCAQWRVEKQLDSQRVLGHWWDYFHTSTIETLLIDFNLVVITKPTIILHCQSKSIILLNNYNEAIDEVDNRGFSSKSNRD
jgi:hypothetical protein